MDNSVESLHGVLTIFETLEELNKLASKGWTGGPAFYEFYRLGGLHNIMDCFNWLGQQLENLKDEDVNRSHFMFIERSCLLIKDFF